MATAPKALMLRTALLPVSATYNKPLLPSTATPEGRLKRAAAPTPFTKPWVPSPASRCTAPVLVTMRTTWFPASATKT